MLFFDYSIATCIFWIVVIVYVLIRGRKIKQLQSQPVIEELHPSVAIIIAVRNEEDDLEDALKSICNINYPNYRIIVVNDRSTDRTPYMLKGFTEQYPNLIVTTIDALPYGWLGKNNALYQGYKSSSEEWLLFTDADIVFHPDALSKALSYAVNNKLDHLAILPEVISRSVILNSVLGTFSLMLMMFTRPWNAKNPRSKASIGIGAFNLVRRDAYEKAGTHSRIKLRPDDDLKLGEIIKWTGLRQDVLKGKDYIRLEWYRSLRQFRDGLMKNSFAAFNYNPFKAFINAVGVLLWMVLPEPAIFIFGPDSLRSLAAFVLFCQVIYMSIVLPNKWWYAFVIPFAGLLMVYIMIKSAILTLKQGGIYWRDSFYSLAMLKEED